MGIFGSGNSFGARVLTGEGIANRRKRADDDTDRPMTGDLDGSFTQDRDHSKRSFRPD